jgi:hypothetical protein
MRAPPMPPLDPAALQRTLSGTLTASTLDAIASAPRALQPGLILGSPEFMRR